MSIVASAAASSEPKTLQWSQGLAEVPSDLNPRGISCSGSECSFTLWADGATWCMGCQLKPRHSVGQLCSVTLAVRLHIRRSFPCISFAFIFLSSSLVPLTDPSFTGLSFFQPAQRTMNSSVDSFLSVKTKLPNVHCLQDHPQWLMGRISQPFFSTCVDPVALFHITFSFFCIIFFCWANNSLGLCDHPSIVQKIMPWSWFLSQRYPGLSTVKEEHFFRSPLCWWGWFHFMHLPVNAKKLLRCGKVGDCDCEQQNWGAIKNTSWTGKLVEIQPWC